MFSLEIIDLKKRNFDWKGNGNGKLNRPPKAVCCVF